MKFGTYLNSRANRVIKEMNEKGFDTEELRHSLFLEWNLSLDSVAEIDKDLKERIDRFEFTKAHRKEMKAMGLEDNKKKYIIDKLADKINSLI